MSEENNYSIEKLINSANYEIEKPPFSQLYNFVLNNLIEPTALAVWSYLQSKSPDWRPRKKEIQNHFPTLGRDKTHKAFMILKACGLYEPIPIKEKGKITDWKIKIKCGYGQEEQIMKWKSSFLKQLSGKESNNNQTTENPYCGNQTTENPYCGENLTTHAQQGENHNTEIPDSGDSVHILKKDLLLNKETNKDLNKALAVLNLTSPSSLAVLNKTAKTLVTDNPHNIPDDLIEAWITTRKKKRAAITPKVWQLLNEELSKCDNPLQAFKDMVLGGWQSLKAEWVNKRGNVKQLDHNTMNWADNIDKDMF